MSPHGNAWIVAADGGVVLFDAGIGGPGRLAMLEEALGEAGFVIDQVKLVLCTHAHSDHIGLVGPVADAAGCEYWAHRDWFQIRPLFEDAGAVMDRKVAAAIECGFAPAALSVFQETEDDGPPGVVEGLRRPDRLLDEGDVVHTDLGPWYVHLTPGHSSCHVVFHQPESGVLVSGDHLMGNALPSFDHGLIEDSVGDYLASLSQTEALNLDLCLPGHGRPFGDPTVKIEETRRRVIGNLDQIEAVLDTGELSPFEIISALVPGGLEGMRTSEFTLPVMLSYLDHLVLQGRARALAPEGSDGPPRKWTAR